MTPLAPPIIHASRAELPVLLSVPHSGRAYPDWLIDLASAGRGALVPLEDPLVDRLVWKALRHGVGAAIAQAPRAAIDCNRAEDEVDPTVVEGPVMSRLTARTRGGLGIVPARTQRHGRLWRRPIPRQQLEDRLDQVHRPYHGAIAQGLDQLVDRFGCALLLDCHSMPPPTPETEPVVFGDCFGRTAPPWLVFEAQRIAADAGFRSAVNDPFAGGYILERHASPARHIYALQVEIDRRVYLDASFMAPGAGFDRVATLFERLALDLASALLGDAYATAAE